MVLTTPKAGTAGHGHTSPKVRTVPFAATVDMVEAGTSTVVPACFKAMRERLRVVPLCPAHGAVLYARITSAKARYWRAMP